MPLTAAVIGFAALFVIMGTVAAVSIPTVCTIEWFVRRATTRRSSQNLADEPHDLSATLPLPTVR